MKQEFISILKWLTHERSNPSIKYMLKISNRNMFKIKNKESRAMMLFCSRVDKSIYLLKVSNRDASITYEICSELTIKTSEQCLWHRFHYFSKIKKNDFYFTWRSIFVLEIFRFQVLLYKLEYKFNDFLKGALLRK